MSAAASSGHAPFLVVGRTALMVAALASVGIFHVWSHTRVTAAGYRLGELQRKQESLRAERNRLEVEVATLRAPGRLEAFARARLGLAPPAPGAVVAGRAGEVAAGRAGRAGGEENPRLTPAEPAVRARYAGTALRPATSGTSPAPLRTGRTRPEERVALRDARRAVGQ
jgi:cell division protein FtsL